MDYEEQPLTGFIKTRIDSLDWKEGQQSITTLLTLLSGS